MKYLARRHFCRKGCGCDDAKKQSVILGYINMSVACMGPGINIPPACNVRE